MNDYVFDEYVDALDAKAKAEKEKFCIDSLKKANWTFRKLAVLNSLKNEHIELIADEIARLNSWLEKENKIIDDDIAYFEGLLRDYYTQEREKDDKFRLLTPYGKVTSRQSKDYTYNEELLLDELKDTEYIVVKESIDKNKLKGNITVLDDGRAVTNDGVVLEGLTVTDKISYYVKPVKL